MILLVARRLLVCPGTNRQHPAAAGIRPRREVQEGAACSIVRHRLAESNTCCSGLLIRGFGVQVPGGAPDLTWGYPRSAWSLRACFVSMFAPRLLVSRDPVAWLVCAPVSPPADGGGVPFKGKSQAGSIPASPEELYRDLARGPDASLGLLVHQGDVLRSYADKHTRTADLALELPTGTGKTLPGLVDRRLGAADTVGARCLRLPDGPACQAGRRDGRQGRRAGGRAGAVASRVAGSGRGSMRSSCGRGDRNLQHGVQQQPEAGR